MLRFCRTHFLSHAVHLTFRWRKWINKYISNSFFVIMIWIEWFLTLMAKYIYTLFTWRVIAQSHSASLSFILPLALPLPLFFSSFRSLALAFYLHCSGPFFLLFCLKLFVLLNWVRNHEWFLQTEHKVLMRNAHLLVFFCLAANFGKQSPLIS